MKNLPSLNALRVFEAVARYQSLVKAAEELFVTSGAVSRQIRQLETALGVILFERRNRGIFLTSAGEQLKQACQQAFGLMALTIDRLQQTSQLTPLVVSCEPTIMMKWLIPKLITFKVNYPDIEIHLVSGGGYIDFSRSSVNLAIRRNDFLWDRRYVAERLGKEWIGPICLPETENHAITHQPLTLLHTHTRPEAWNDWMSGSKQIIPKQHEHWFEHFYILLEAVMAGHGVGISSIYMIEQELSDKRVSAPYGFIPDGSAYYLISPETFEANTPQSLFLGWLKKAFHDSQTRLADFCH
ncbi:LysR family transcriptional regulator [Xenorhabdus sp. DI]|uniref:LysR family transcriptional regulator n=1 Tax=Xenorhabdus doucetiae TaxID=351671 RepID=UPI0019988A70|nr:MULTISPECIES: LysR family transcriptional regulator [unclassified Xenorhabdus]MBD2785537.1 LysR family transcriptional regulator [Xenorhabdus sp. 3]MBD2786922.1 LysR family transcriptional regulator [Xenorhabdus sp. DI]MBD2796804.1 LysR family transcriptional regulator [Xenorhabdus sp. 18]